MSASMREPFFTVDNPPPFAEWPNEYALRCSGVCMEPEIPDGAAVLIDKSLEPRAGDYVCIWARQPSGQIKAFVKRLTFGIMPGLRYPVRMSANSNVAPVILFEQFNPPRQYQANPANVYGVHRCIGYSIRDPGIVIGTMLNLDREAVHWFEKPKRARKLRVRRAA